MLKKTTVLLTCLITTLIHAQSPNFEWIKTVGGTGNDQAVAMTTDDSGNVYSTGILGNSADFDPGPGTFDLIGAGAYVQKLDANGNFMWATFVGGDWGKSITLDVLGNIYVTGFWGSPANMFIAKLDPNGVTLWYWYASSFSGQSLGWSIVADDAGNIFVSGQFDGTVDFDPGPADFNLTSNGGWDIFVQKLDSAGNFLWAKSMGGTLDDWNPHLALDNLGDLLITGNYMDVVDFDPSVAVFNMTSNGQIDCFVQKLDSDGNLIYAKSIGGSSDDMGRGITSDAIGNVYVTGLYVGTVDFDPGAGIFNSTATGSMDGFIEKLNANGDFVWAKFISGSSYNEYGESITVDVSGNPIIVGHFHYDVDFDPGIGTSILTSNGLEDVFILKLDTNGTFMWLDKIGGAEQDLGYAVKANALGDIYVVGNFGGTFTVNSTTLSSNGSNDFFILKYNQCNPDVSVSTSGLTIMANATGAQYQWLDCDNNFAEILGETNQNFTATTNGNFAVRVTENGCTDTSTCIAISTIELGENSLWKDVYIFPNPNSGNVTINLGTLNDVSIRVLSINGQIIYQKENINSAIHQFEFNESAGVYFIEVYTPDMKQCFKLIKE